MLWGAPVSAGPLKSSDLNFEIFLNQITGEKHDSLHEDLYLHLCPENSAFFFMNV